MRDELAPAEELQIIDDGQAGVPAWFVAAFNRAEDELDRPVMRRLFIVFVGVNILVYGIAGALLTWTPGA